MGALSLRRAQPLDDQERLLFLTIGNLIAPTLAHSEYSRQLEVEVFQLRDAKDALDDRPARS